MVIHTFTSDTPKHSPNIPAVLPGSAIGMVYEDAEVLYKEVKEGGTKLFEDALATLFDNVSFLNPGQSLKSNIPGRIIGFNTLPFPRLDVVKVPLGGPQSARLKSEMVQVSKDGKTGYTLMDAPKDQSLAYPRGMFANLQAPSGKDLLFPEALEKANKNVLL